MSVERWLPVVGFEGLYEVSDLGRVRGLDREIGHPRGGTRMWPGRVLKQTPMPKGYLAVSLCKDGARTVCTAHSLVCRAFHGAPPRGYTAAHDNGRQQDNRANNLSWKTWSANHMDKHRHGTMPCGDKHYTARRRAA